jgi:ribose/xylose/arabinose/galactoside ABC-type transport system permease subunit
LGFPLFQAAVNVVLNIQPVISTLGALLIFGIASRLMEMEDQTPRIEAVGILTNLTST